jgi:RNA polymerase sigma factor (sigma-70 family)
VERREDGPEAQQPSSLEDGAGPLRRWSDAALVAAMRRNERGAFREFFERFAPLIAALARSHRLPATDPDERTIEFLDDVALRLCLPTTALPRSLAAWLAASFRRRSLNGARDIRQRRRLRDGCAIDTGGFAERVVSSAVSENAVRSSYGPATDAATLSPALERLALELEHGLSPDERRLLAWLGQRVPQREIAAWLGTTHGALRVRVTRLRARLRDAAFRHADRLAGDERAEIDRFFRRIDVVVPVTLAPPRASPGISGNRNPAVEDPYP